MHVGRSGPTGSVSPGRVELRLAGTFRVIRGGAALTDGEIGSRKSRTLLKLLTVERPRLVPVDRIVEVLWPDERPAAPEQNVATLVSRLRAVLGPDLIQGGRAGYRLADPDVVVDLDAAAALCEQAEGKLGGAPAVALAAAERAHELLSPGTAIGDEPYADWAEPAREQLRELLRRARLAAAEAALATGNPRQAAGYAEGAVVADPLDEAAHRWYMSATAAAGEPARALAAYEALRQRLGEELGADPAPQTRELHLAILREQGGRPGRDGTVRPGGTARSDGAAADGRAGPRPAGGRASGKPAQGGRGAWRHGRPADPRHHARPGPGDRARAVRSGARGQAARGQRPRLRVRQRPHPRGAVRQHAGTDPAGAPSAGRRAVHRPAGIAGQARRRGGRLAAGGPGLAAGRRGRHGPVRGQRRGGAGLAGAGGG